MTRKEAIFILMLAKNRVCDDELNEALEMAIKALEQEPCDKCVYSTKDGYCQYDDITETIPSLTPRELIHGKCNQCKYYEGVHDVQGHAPCSYHKIGGVMWDWYCSQFESTANSEKE